ncbi:aspartyl protease UND-like [Henckelia pumila]|uniref:aspartyl protease UND-like n=1 Tax=Henckelia pumila TaxID=405737 RepID=UPI003C6E28E4
MMLLKFEVLLFLYLIPVVFAGEVRFPPRLVTRLIHFNSIQSPYYPKHINESVAEIDLHVLLSRVFHGTMSAPVSPMKTSGFLVHLKVGKERVDQYLFLDTGSTNLWIHCKPPEIHGMNPMYDSRKSSTYRAEHCLTSDFCHGFGYKCDRSLRCEYVLRYGNGFQSKGHLARETFVFQGTGGSLFGRDEVILDNILFGCSKETTLDSDGILGLGNSKYSLLAQTYSSRFSYCLGYLDLSYDHNRLIIGNPIKTGLIHEIPLIVDRHYYIDITAIEIGGAILDVDVNILKRNVEKSSSGMIIDTGSTISYFPRLVFTPFATALKDLIDRRSLRRYPDDRSRLCYERRFRKELAGFPLVRFWFGIFAYMEFGIGSLFSQLTDGHFCLAFQAIEEVDKYMDFGILGILLQQGYYISYNLQASAPTLSFEKMDCSALEYDIHDEL